MEDSMVCPILVGTCQLQANMFSQSIAPGALGMRLVTIGELDTHREESPELIGSEAVEDIGEAGEMF
jgi:hypothetical protein